MSARVTRLRGGVRLEAPTMDRAREFLAAVERSRALHGKWVSPPDTRAAYRTYIERTHDGSYFGHFVIDDDDALVGVINISEVVRGALQSGYLGYYAFAPHAGRGMMRAALAQVVRAAFRDYGLHRLEANIQPDNLVSRALARTLGLQLEGYSPRYLKIRGRWRDHERWAITLEAWRAQARQRPAGTVRKFRVA